MVEYGMKTLNTMMIKGSLVVDNTSKVRSPPNPISTSPHKLLSHAQCALVLQRNPKVVPCFLNLLLKLI
jgi:hypothetical protein